MYHDRLYSAGKEFFCLENIKEGREDEGNHRYMP